MRTYSHERNLILTCLAARKAFRTGNTEKACEGYAMTTFVDPIRKAIVFVSRDGSREIIPLWSGPVLAAVNAASNSQAVAIAKQWVRAQ